MPTYPIQFRRDTEANWNAANPILRDGEMGIAKPDEVASGGVETLRFKIGNGSARWSDLPWGSGPAGPAPEHEWQGTSLRVKNPDGSWGDAIQLKGAMGPKGQQGPPGPEGTATPATKTKLGGVIVGEGLDIDENGCLNAHTKPVPLATAATPGLMQPDNVTCAVNEAGVLSGISMFFNTRLVLTTSGIFTVPVSTWYKIVIVGAGGAGGSTYAGGSAGGHSSFGDLLTARGGSGGGGCAYCGGGGGYAGDVVTGIVFLEAETKISFIVGAGGFPQSGGSATAPIQATGTNIGYYASNVGGTGANNGTAIFYYNDGKDLCGGNGGTGGRNGSGYGGGGGGAAGYVAIPYAGQGLYRPVGGYGCDSGTAGAAYTGTNYAYLAGGNGGDGAIILEFYDPNKPTA